MRPFAKVILMSFRYKWSILLSIVNALLIAVLWGGSISAVYPFVQIIFEGQTAHTWVEGKITDAETETVRLEAEITALRSGFDEASPEERDALSTQINLRSCQLEIHGQTQQYYRSLEPFLQSWAPVTPFSTLALVIGLLVIATVIKGACLVLNMCLVARVANGVTMDLRRRFFGATLNMDQQKLEHIGTSGLMTMFSHNVRLVQGGLMGLYGKSIREPLKIVACLVVACLISWRLLLISLVIVPFGCYLMHYLARRMKRAVAGEIKGFASFFQTLMETLMGIKAVKIFTRERMQRRRFKEDSRALYNLGMRITFYDSLIRPLSELIGILVVATAILCGAYLVFNDTTHLFGLQISPEPLSASAMFTFFAMLAGIADPARKLSDIYNLLVRAKMGSKILFATFETPPRIASPRNPTPAPRHSKSIRLENVTFGYQPKNPVLRDVNLEIPFGQTVAVVGANGSGKSTIVNLIARFYDPQAGNIFLDDVNVRDIRLRQLRKQLGIVTQDPILFSDTVWMNIQYGDVDATEEQVRQAADLARVTEFLPALPGEFHAQVGERGSSLSGGQRQRVALARAILSNPRILVLDEPTSQVDQQAEAILHESLSEFLRGRTVILITHRDTTVRMADRVIVMEAGRIIEERAVSEWTGTLDNAPATLEKVA